LADLATGVNNVTIDSENRIYLLMNDLDLSAYNPWTPIGDTGFRKFDKNFKGTFHGRDKTISNLTLRNPNPTTGLFGVAGFDGGDSSNINKRAYIRNLKVELSSSQPDLTASGNTDRGIGVVVGAADLVDFTKVTVSGALKVTGNSITGGVTFVGGLAGDLDGANSSRINVTNCTAEVDIDVEIPLA
jgi:hypothetical protein